MSADGDPADAARFLPLGEIAASVLNGAVDTSSARVPELSPRRRR
jgi:hypothetical protein